MPSTRPLCVPLRRWWHLTPILKHFRPRFFARFFFFFRLKLAVKRYGSAPRLLLDSLFLLQNELGFFFLFPEALFHRAKLF